MILRPRGAAFAAFLVLALAACSTGGLSGEKDGPFAPGSKPGAEAVDGLTVGHRLMAAGEYELALRAYYRAAAEQGATVDVLSAIGSADLKLGRLNQAEQMLRRATESDQTFVPACHKIGGVRMNQRKKAEAARAFYTGYGGKSGRTSAIRQSSSRAE